MKTVSFHVHLNDCATLLFPFCFEISPGDLFNPHYCTITVTTLNAPPLRSLHDLSDLKYLFREKLTALISNILW